MEDIIETILTLLPIAFIIVIRFLVANKQEQPGPQGPLSKILAEGPSAPRPSSGGGREHQRKTSLSLAKSYARRERIRPPEEDLQVIPRGLSDQQSLVNTNNEEARKDVPRLVFPSHEEIHPKEPVLQWLERWSPLKRAIIWSEILGPPKGL